MKRRSDSHERRKGSSEKNARDNYSSGDEGDDGTRRRNGRGDEHGGKAKKPRETREEHSQNSTERKSKNRMKQHKKEKKKRKKERHRRGERRRGESPKGDKCTSEKLRKCTRNGSGSSSSLSSESEETETLARERKEWKSVSRGQELKDSERGDSSAVLGEDVQTPPPADSAASPRDTGSRGEDEGATLDEDAPTPPVSPGVQLQEAELSVASVTDKSSFFAKLRALEGKKGTVGTVHATGVPSGGGGKGGGTGTIKPSDWECLKCGKSNYKNATSCDRCVDLRLSKKGVELSPPVLSGSVNVLTKYMFPVIFPRSLAHTS